MPEARSKSAHNLVPWGSQKLFPTSGHLSALLEILLQLPDPEKFLASSLQLQPSAQKHLAHCLTSPHPPESGPFSAGSRRLKALPRCQRMCGSCPGLPCLAHSLRCIVQPPLLEALWAGINHWP